jgi:hypothetical protein
MNNTVTFGFKIEKDKCYDSSLVLLLLKKHVKEFHVLRTNDISIQRTGHIYARYHRNLPRSNLHTNISYLGYSVQRWTVGGIALSFLASIRINTCSAALHPFSQTHFQDSTKKNRKKLSCSLRAGSGFKIKTPYSHV